MSTRRASAARRPPPALRARDGSGRLVRLRLTERGRALEEVIGQEMDQLTARALASFTAADRAVIIGALRDIRRNLRA